MDFDDLRRFADDEMAPEFRGASMSATQQQLASELRSARREIELLYEANRTLCAQVARLQREREMLMHGRPVANAQQRRLAL